MIADSYNERPIYISRTAGNYAETLGLRQQRDHAGAGPEGVHSHEGHGTRHRQVQGDGYMDVNRTLTLWDSVFQAPKSLAKRNGWVDKPSIGIPYLYIATGVELEQTLDAVGKSQYAPRIVTDTRKIVTALDLQDYFPGMNVLPPTPVVPSGDSAVGAPVPVKKK